MFYNNHSDAVERIACSGTRPQQVVELIQMKRLRPDGSVGDGEKWSDSGFKTEVMGSADELDVRCEKDIRKKLVPTVLA